jgi:hypothetical protein
MFFEDFLSNDFELMHVPIHMNPISVDRACDTARHQFLFLLLFLLQVLVFFD